MIHFFHWQRWARRCACLLIIDDILLIFLLAPRGSIAQAWQRPTMKWRKVLPGRMCQPPQRLWCWATPLWWTHCPGCPLTREFPSQTSTKGRQSMKGNILGVIYFSTSLNLIIHRLERKCPNAWFLYISTIRCRSALCLFYQIFPDPALFDLWFEDNLENLQVDNLSIESRMRIIIHVSEIYVANDFVSIGWRYLILPYSRVSNRSA